MADSICSVDHCEKLAKTRKMCWMHYTRLRKHGDVNWVPERPRIPGRTCGVEGCELPYRRSGMCDKHSQAAKAEARPPKRWCRGCGSMLPEKSGKGRRYCSDDCRPAAIATPSDWKPCERCGLPIDMTVRGSDGRKRRSDIKMCVYCQRAKHRRHKTSLGLIVARDGWDCKLCGEPVNPSLSGRNPAGASVDHVKPFSLGGTHDLDNLQLAHLMCNQIKNNKVDADCVA